MSNKMSSKVTYNKKDLQSDTSIKWCPECGVIVLVTNNATKTKTTDNININRIIRYSIFLFLI